MSVQIHKSAIVDGGATLGDGVIVEPFAIIESDVTVGANTRIGAHAVVRSHTEIGADCRIFQFASIGEAPQHQSYAGEKTRLVIGARNTIREYCTLNRGTADGLGVTQIGDDNFIMAYAHIAHDCTLGDHIIFANGASLAGHVEVGDYAILGGFSLVHQYCNIGAHCITGIGAVCFQDVPPFLIAAGHAAAPFGVNSKGLRRRNFAEPTIAALKRAYKLVYRSGLDLRAAIAEIDALCDAADGESARAELTLFSDFLRRSQRGIIR